MSQDNEGTLENSRLDSDAEANTEKDEATSDVNSALEAANKKAQDNWDKYLRAVAELENARRRARIDLENAHKYGLEKFLKQLIQVVDSFEMGLAASKEGLAENPSLKSVVEGVELTYKQMLDVFGNFNIDKIDPKGEKFDPNLHEAISMQDSEEHESGNVINVVQYGFSLHGRVIRPARVIVAK